MRARTKTVGVLGGMGPAATLDFFARVLAATNAGTDQDHLRLIIDCNPKLPNRNDAIAGSGPSPGAELAAMARGLEQAGAELLVMPCNTAHAFLTDIKSATALPVISIIDVTVAATVSVAPNASSVGLLAAEGCIKAGLYQSAFAKLGVATLTPEAKAQELFMRTLYRIKAGDLDASVKADMREIADGLAAAGARAIVAGCTEVPLVLTPADTAKPLIDSTDCLVKATVAAARLTA